MRKYTADDGLRLLDYLEISGLRPGEKQEFRLQWDEIYKECESDPLQATFELYTCVLPVNCQDDIRATLRLNAFRQVEFMAKADEKNVRFLAQFGVTLDEILDEDADEVIN